MRDLDKEKLEKKFCCSVFTEKKRLGELVKKQTRSFEVVFLDNVIKSHYWKTPRFFRKDPLSKA